MDGSIKLKSGAGLSAVTQRGVTLTDGTKLPADLIVYATGFEPPTAGAAQILAPEVIRKVGRILAWGPARKAILVRGKVKRATFGSRHSSGRCGSRVPVSRDRIFSRVLALRSRPVSLDLPRRSMRCRPRSRPTYSKGRTSIWIRALAAVISAVDEGRTMPRGRCEKRSKAGQSGAAYLSGFNVRWRGRLNQALRDPDDAVCLRP